jgi:hypothetical protein
MDISTSLSLSLSPSPFPLSLSLSLSFSPKSSLSLSPTFSLYPTLSHTHFLSQPISIHQPINPHVHIYNPPSLYSFSRLHAACREVGIFSRLLVGQQGHPPGCRKPWNGLQRGAWKRLCSRLSGGILISSGKRQGVVPSFEWGEQTPGCLLVSLQGPQQPGKITATRVHKIAMDLNVQEK